MATVNKVTPSSPRLQALMSEVENGNIKVPVFQRDFVWEDDQIMSLLDSIYNGYPVGSLLLWQTKDALNFHRDLGGFVLPATPEDYPVKYVLDGQQRLTTLYAVFHSNDTTTNPELARRFRVAFDPASESFLPEDDADPQSTLSLRDALDVTKFVKALSRFTEAHQQIIGNLQERFKDYEFPVVTIRERTNQEVCRIFQRINSSGTQLGTLDLLSAWTWSDSFDLRDQILDVQQRLAAKGFEDLDDTQIMRCLAAIVNESVDTNELVDSNPDQLVAGMAKVKQAINASVDFLADEFHIRNVVFVPFAIMLVPLAYFFSHNLKPNAEQRLALKRWFWFCAFTQRYKAGTNRLVQEDLAMMKQLAADSKSFGLGNVKADPQLFTKTWRINSTAAKASICMLAQLHPKSFFSGSAVNLSAALEAYNAREFHHIYPKAYLSSLGIPFHQANVIANICMISSSDNKTISDRPPSVYFSDIPDKIRDDVFARARIPEAARNGGQEFTNFIKERSEYLAELASKLIADGSVT